MYKLIFEIVEKSKHCLGLLLALTLDHKSKVTFSNLSLKVVKLTIYGC